MAATATSQKLREIVQFNGRAPELLAVKLSVPDYLAVTRSHLGAMASCKLYRPVPILRENLRKYRLMVRRSQISAYAIQT